MHTSEANHLDWQCFMPGLKTGARILLSEVARRTVSPLSPSDITFSGRGRSPDGIVSIRFPPWFDSVVIVRLSVGARETVVSSVTI